MIETGTEQSRSGRPWYLWVAVGLVVLVIVIVIAIALRPRPQDSYDDAVRDRFMSACTAQGGEPVSETCACFYDRIEQDVPFDRFETLDETLGQTLATQPLATQTQASAAGSAVNLPEDLNLMLTECVAETG